MTREEAIKELSYIADEMPSMECADWIEAISMAIEALEQEPCNDAISRFEGMTNGEVMKAVFPYIRAYENDTVDDMYGGLVDVMGLDDDPDDCTIFSLRWWNAPYKGGAQHD